ncbi:hypothetical protein V8D89_001556 [Ganoderma adspersum]
MIGSVFPIITHSITDNLGTDWGEQPSQFSRSGQPAGAPLAVSVFGFISLFLIPIPICSCGGGPTLRAHPAMAKEAGTIVAKMRAQAAAAAKEKSYS